VADYLAQTLAEDPGLTEKLARALKQIRVRKLALADFAPSKRTLERGDVDGVTAEFRRFLLAALAADGDEDELAIVELDTEIADLRRKIAALEEKIKSKSLSLMGKLAVFGIALLLLVIAVRWVPFEMANPLERPTETASLVAFTASELTQVSLEDIDSQSAMFTSEPSALETPQPSATTSDTPTETYTPTLTETHTPPPNPTLTVTMPPPTVRIIVSSANLRAGPGTSYAIVGSIREGETAVVLATNSDGDWYNVELSDGKRVWIAKSNTEPVDSANMGELSVAVTIPPLPIPSATTSPTFTPVAPETHSTPFTPSPTFTPRY
jgi:cytoskeletal protein RodZ